MSDPPAPETVHQPVLLNEVLEALNPQAGSIILDGTVGAAGHARALAERVGPGGRIIGLDRDPRMLELAAQRTRELPVVLFHQPYDAFETVLDELEISQIDGLLLDLGLSSDQLAWPERGFSFRQDAPLDMRFDPTSGEPTAADLLARLPAAELADLFFQYGEERFSRKIARRIVEARAETPIRTTAELADLIYGAIGRRPRGGIDPATRVFQALRIAVNRELERLESILDHAPARIRPGGRIAVISFHSLEDRIVKWRFRHNSCWKILTRKPMVPTEDEASTNPRSRSAKLRVAERCPDLTSQSPVLT
jgi:16S rRNA (cytosine1402-N4)-methyltransferase